MSQPCCFHCKCSTRTNLIHTGHRYAKKFCASDLKQLDYKTPHIIPMLTLFQLLRLSVENVH